MSEQPLKYKDPDGNPCTLDKLCRIEPAWAANRLRVELARVTALKAENELLKKGHAEWVIEQWDLQVSGRPMVNQYRRTLDNVWRQIYRRLTGEDLPRPDAYPRVPGEDAFKRAQEVE
jgi:hypothetical protein